MVYGLERGRDETTLLDICKSRIDGEGEKVKTTLVNRHHIEEASPKKRRKKSTI